MHRRETSIAQDSLSAFCWSGRQKPSARGSNHPWWDYLRNWTESESTEGINYTPTHSRPERSRVHLVFSILANTPG